MKVSIITATFNSSLTIEDTIKSVLAQTYEDIEYIIVDGASTDGALDVINKYKKNIFKIISEPDRGIYDAMNKGLLAASGDIVGFLNADDIFYDNSVIKRVVEHFKSVMIDCVYGNLVFVSCNDPARVTRIWKSRDFVDGLFEKSWTPAHPTFYCKKILYDQLGLYRTDFRIASDGELMYRFLQKNHIRSKYINTNFVRMRDSGVSTRGITSTIIITREMKRAIIENGGKFNLIKYLFCKFLKVSEVIKAFKKRGLE